MKNLVKLFIFTIIVIININNSNAEISPSGTQYFFSLPFVSPGDTVFLDSCNLSTQDYSFLSNKAKEFGLIVQQTCMSTSIPSEITPSEPTCTKYDATKNSTREPKVFQNIIYDDSCAAGITDLGNGISLVNEDGNCYLKNDSGHSIYYRFMGMENYVGRIVNLTEEYKLENGEQLDTSKATGTGPNGGGKMGRTGISLYGTEISNKTKEFYVPVTDFGKDKNVKTWTKEKVSFTLKNSYIYSDDLVRENYSVKNNNDYEILPNTRGITTIIKPKSIIRSSIFTSDGAIIGPYVTGDENIETILSSNKPTTNYYYRQWDYIRPKTHTTYSCPSGGTLSGTQCDTCSTPIAPIPPIDPIISTSINSCNDIKPKDNGHIIFVIGTPTSKNQAYIKDVTNCGYTCKDSYTGTNCEIAPIITTPNPVTPSTFFSPIKIVGTLQSQGNSELLGQNKNFSDLSKASQRSVIRKNATLLTKNMNSGSTVNGVKYIYGDIIISGNQNYETLIVKNGNVIISGDLNTDGKKLGIIVLKDGYNVDNGYEGNGNIYIDKGVKYINATIYADGGVISSNNGNPYITDSETRKIDLQNQLVIKGSIFSRNTIGGAVLGTSGKYLLPGGGTTSDFDKAMIYDMNYLRRGNANRDSARNLGNNSNNVVIIYNSSIQTNPPKGFSSK